MEEISIAAKDNEVTDFLKHERPLWPQAPTSCTVAECDQTRAYSSFRDFMDHWKSVHTETDSSYKCKICRRLYGTIKHKKAHEKTECHSGQHVEFETIVKPNINYIDPKDKLPYQLGTKEFRNDMRKVQRELASAKRKVDALEWQRRHSELSVEEVKHHVCRDERIVERHGKVYKDTNMWESPSKRKRIRLE
ncbi:MAG: hypothetical protein N0E48_03060 [Candidatus Thiodiazotropha endolucinida]|nr:hypothetical protein [Candidatus Thiodiazotropha taylori]MCW4342342.1 hypothetical protein [Candidatus Thiodiazotropha endolucinida]